MSQSEPLYFPPSPPSSVKMDSTLADENCDNSSSPRARSIVSSRVSVSGEFVLGSNISTSPQTHTLGLSHQPPVSSPNHYSSSTPYLNTPAAESSYLPTPASQSYSQFPTLASTGVDSTWNHSDQLHEGPRSSLLHSQQDHRHLTSGTRPTGRSTSMRYYDPIPKYFRQALTPSFKYSRSSVRSCFHHGTKIILYMARFVTLTFLSPSCY